MTAAPVATERVLRGVTAQIHATIVDQDGTAAAPVGGVTVDVARGDGTVLATARATTAGTTGQYSATLSVTELATLDCLTCTWKDGGVARVTTVVDVVGAFYFSKDDALGFDDSLNQADRYSDEKIIGVRREVEDECERITGVAWVPRYRRVQLDGKGWPVVNPFTITADAATRDGNLRLPDQAVRTVRTIRSYQDATTYILYTSTELGSILATETGELERRDFGSFAWGVGNIVVEYEHGHDQPPSDLRHAALTRLRTRLNMELSAVDSRATSFVQQGGGSFTLAQPGRAGFETGIPEVDAVYLRYSQRIPGVY